MDDSLVYSVWYHKIFNTTKKGNTLFQKYGDYKTLYEKLVSGEEDSFLEEARRDAIRKFSFIDAMRIAGECEDNGWQIVDRLSSLYPSELKELDGSPHVLFCDGDTSLLNRNVKFSIVGSRNPTPEAQNISFNCAYNLAKTGAVIVSGAALGVDSAAHLGAVKSGGGTIGVLGCGLGNSYMDRIGEFYDRVKENGLYISPFMPYADSTRYTFPERNKIISGLSRAVLVTYASEKSGSLITAEAAKKQKRRVYALSPDIARSDGCEKLIFEGAYIFYNAGDIAYPLKEFYTEGTFNDSYCNKPVSMNFTTLTVDAEAFPAPRGKTASEEKKSAAVNVIKTKKISIKKEAVPAASENPLPDYLSDDAKKIYELSGNSPMNIDDLVGITGLNISQVLIAVSELEAELLIKRLAGNRIERI